MQSSSRSRIIPTTDRQEYFTWESKCIMKSASNKMFLTKLQLNNSFKEFNVFVMNWTFFNLFTIHIMYLAKWPYPNTETIIYIFWVPSSVVELFILYFIFYFIHSNLLHGSLVSWEIFIEHLKSWWLLRKWKFIERLMYIDVCCKILLQHWINKST